MKADILFLVEHLHGKVLDISYILAAQAKELASQTGGKSIAVILGKDLKKISWDLSADELWLCDHPTLAEFTAEGYVEVLRNLVHKHQPGLVFFGDSSIGGETASTLAAKLNLPIANNVVEVCKEGDRFVYSGKLFAGKMAIKGELSGNCVLIAIQPGGFKVEQGKGAIEIVSEMDVPDLSGLRTKVRKINEPEAGDVDITEQKVLVVVGRGIQQGDNMELAEELATELGTVVAGSRPVIDQAWLPITRLIGKSGKAVKPAVYLAFGISGAPEHTETIMDSEVIIAINTDEKAPIFNIAKYGAVADMLDVMPALTQQIRRLKGG